MVEVDQIGIPTCTFISSDEKYKCYMNEFMDVYFEHCAQNLFNHLHNTSNWKNFRYNDDFDKNILNNPNISHIDKIKMILTNSSFIKDEFIDGFEEDGMIHPDKNPDDLFTYFYDACISGVFDKAYFVSL
jgi:hypothetical protein